MKPWPIRRPKPGLESGPMARRAANRGGPGAAPKRPRPRGGPRPRPTGKGRQTSLGRHGHRDIQDRGSLAGPARRTRAQRPRAALLHATGPPPGLRILPGNDQAPSAARGHPQAGPPPRFAAFARSRARPRGSAAARSESAARPLVAQRYQPLSRSCSSGGSGL